MNPKSPLIRIFMIVIGALLAASPFLVPVPWLRIALGIGFILFCHLCIIVLRQTAAAPRTAPAPAEDPHTPPQKTPEEQQETITIEKLAALSKFASVVSHELKNPLASLKNIAYFLTKTADPANEKGNRMLTMLSGEIDRMDAMINRLSEISRVKRVNKSPASIAHLVEETLAAFKPEPPIQMTKQVEPFIATVDPDKFKQIVMHLLTNARDAMPNGGQIVLTVKKNGETFTLTVQDNGTGMDAQTLAQVFNPMFTTKTKVLGMGLTIAKDIVETHKGTIAAQSQPGTGSVFTVTMPL